MNPVPSSSKIYWDPAFLRVSRDQPVFNGAARLPFARPLPFSLPSSQYRLQPLQFAFPPPLLVGSPPPLLCGLPPPLVRIPPQTGVVQENRLLKQPGTGASFASMKEKALKKKLESEKVSAVKAVQNQPTKVTRTKKPKKQHGQREAPDVYEVEKVIASKLENGVKSYKLVWKDYPESEATWVDGDNCNCELLINEYEATEREKRRKNRRCGLGETLDAKRESATAGGEKDSAQNELLSENLLANLEARMEHCAEDSSGNSDPVSRWNTKKSEMLALIMDACENLGTEAFEGEEWQRFEKISDKTETLDWEDGELYRNTMPERILRYVTNSYGDPFVEMQWYDGLSMFVSFPAALRHYAPIFFPWLTNYLEKHAPEETLGKSDGELTAVIVCE